MNEKQILTLVQNQSSVEHFYNALLPMVMQFIGADVGLLESGSTSVVRGAATSLFERSNRQRYAAELNAVFTVARRTGAAADTLVLGIRKVRCSRYYQEFVRPREGSETLFAFPQMCRRATSFLLLGRNQGSPGFRYRDVERVQGLLPVVAVATRALQASVAQLDIQLSGREEEILLYLRSGYRSADIAALLGTSVHTVRNQVARLMSRIGVSTRAELVALLP